MLEHRSNMWYASVRLAVPIGMAIEQIARLSCKNALVATHWANGLVLECEMLSYLIRNMV